MNRYNYNFTKGKQHTSGAKKIIFLYLSADCVARHYRRLLILDQPIIIPPICVPDDIIQNHQPLKLQLELLRHPWWQWFDFEPPQPKVRIFIAIDKHLVRSLFYYVLVKDD